MLMKKKFYDYIVEWDDAKNEQNIKKHGVNFETAAYIFNDTLQKQRIIVNCKESKNITNIFELDSWQKVNNIQINSLTCIEYQFTDL